MHGGQPGLLDGAGRGQGGSCPWGGSFFRPGRAEREHHLVRGEGQGPWQKNGAVGVRLGVFIHCWKIVCLSRGLLSSPTSAERLPAEVAHLASLVARRRCSSRSRRPGRGAGRAFLAPPCRGSAARAPVQEKAQLSSLETRKRCSSRSWIPGGSAAPTSHKRVYLIE